MRRSATRGSVTGSWSVGYPLFVNATSIWLDLMRGTVVSRPGSVWLVSTGIRLRRNGLRIVLILVTRLSGRLFDRSLCLRDSLGKFPVASGVIVEAHEG